MLLLYLSIYDLLVFDLYLSLTYLPLLVYAIYFLLVLPHHILCLHKLNIYSSLLSKLDVVSISFLYFGLCFAYLLFCLLGLDVLTTLYALIYVFVQNLPILTHHYIMAYRLGQCCSLRGRYSIDEIFNSDMLIFYLL